MEIKPGLSYGFFNALYSRPKINVLIIIAITVFFAFQIPRLELDNNNIRFIPENDEARITSNYIDDTFGSSLFVLVGLERKYDTVFDRDFLNLIRDYIEIIEKMEITGNINSLVSSDYIYGEGDSIIIQKLIDDDFEGTDAEITELKKRLLSWDLYESSLFSSDFSATQILVPLEISAEDAGRPDVIDSFIQIRDIAREMFAGHAEVYVTGLPVISATINEAVRADLIFLIPLVILVVLLILFFSFRQITAVILPLLTVLIAVIWCMGAMPVFDIKLSVISTVLPVILVAVGSAYGIHIITHYLEDRKLKPESNNEEHRELIIQLSQRIGKSVMLAALTTFAGFIAFCFTSVLPIREFGFFSGFGVVSSYITAIILIPSLLLIRGPQPVKSREKESASQGIANFFMPIVNSKKITAAAAALIAVISINGASKIIIDNSFIEYFKADTDMSRSDRFIREKFGGSKVISVVAMAESTEILMSPYSLKAMDDLNHFLETRIEGTGKTLGFTHLIKRINQVFNAGESPEGLQRISDIGNNDFGPGSFGFGDFGFADFGFGGFDHTDSSSPALQSGFGDEPRNNVITSNPDMGGLVQLLDQARSRSGTAMTAGELTRELEKLVNFGGAAYYEIPFSPERYAKDSFEELQQLISSYLFLISGNLSSYANDPLEPTAIKTTIQLRTLGEQDTKSVLEEIYEYINLNFPENIETIIGGSALIESSLNSLIVQSQIISVIISIFFVFLILTCFYKSLIAGIIGIVPLSISILINFAVMGFLGITLNIGTSMVASVSVGIGIDYTIHFIEAFKREYMAAKGAGDFLKKAYGTSGKAIFINAASVGTGFAVLLFSQFVILENLGLLIALTMGTSALASLTLIPVLLLYIKPKFISRN